MEQADYISNRECHVRHAENGTNPFYFTLRLSQVTIIFEDGTDIYWARQLINQRLQEAMGEMPEDVQPTMSPISTGLGEIYQWVIKAEPNAKKPDGTAYSAMDLREIQDWIVRPQLQRVKGVAESSSIGFNRLWKTYVVAPEPITTIANWRLTLKPP